VTWLMFDYGGVISHPPTRQDLAQLAGVAGVPVPAFADVYWEWRRAYDLAELDVTGYWQRVGRSLGRRYGDAEICELARLDSASWLRLQPGTVALIEDLAAAGRRLAAVERTRPARRRDRSPADSRTFRSSAFQLSAEVREAGPGVL
jgi:putative hydrolase of the HAD superfamily